MRQLDIIHNNASRLNELTNQILDLQKLDGGNLQLNLENADIVAHLKGVVSSFEGFGSKSGCILFFKSQYNSVTCQFDKDKLTKIVSNLLSNAYKYNKENGKVEVEFNIENNHLIIAVKDDGLGIPQEQINDVFKRYYQLENSNKQFEGTGIGLAYVKELVELMKGRVQIESELNVGTTVQVHIPISGYDVNDSNSFTTTLNPNKQVVAIKSEHPANYNEEVRSVLIVEDNDDLRDFISDIFKNDFQIIIAKNGQEGLDVALRYLPDIIISDVMMPLMNGLEMCTKLKQHEQTSHIPILLLTAKDSSESHLSGYQSGADDYIVKPFDSALLKLKVGNILSTRDAARKKFNFPIDTHKFPDIDKQFLQKCTDFIQSNIDIPTFSVEQLANHMAFSQRNFYRKIKALTNLTPSEYIRNFKMNYALQLLKGKKLKVYEVAMAVGYEDATSFSSVFKKQFGTTPSEFIA
jgi:DNA-binding response OmpR family regulator/anti-sigma regulatory factor (Ser/Thr protein kinase)